MGNERTRSSKWTQSDYERVLNSNIKLVDQAKQLKADIELLITYFTDRKSLIPEKKRMAQIIIEEYSKIDGRTTKSAK